MQPFEKKRLKYQSKDSPDQTFHEIRLRAKAYFADERKQKKARNFLAFKSIALFLLVAGSYYLLIVTSSIPRLLFFYTFFGWIFLVVGINLGHDAAHNCVTGRRKLDSFLFQLIFGLQGLSGYLWKIRHNSSHHIFPNIFEYDTDLEVTELILLDPNQEKKWYHKYQYIYASFVYMTFSLSWIFFQDFILMFRKEHANIKMGRIPAVEIFKLIVVKIVYVGIFLVIPMYLSPLPPFWMFMAFLLMHCLVSLFLAFTFFISHHVKETEYAEADEQKGVIANSWFCHQVISTIDFNPESPVANFIFGGFNTHIAHHLFPDISHIHYPALTEIIKETLEEHQLDWYKSFSFFDGVVSHLSHLRNIPRTTYTPDTVSHA